MVHLSGMCYQGRNEGVAQLSMTNTGVGQLTVMETLENVPEYSSLQQLVLHSGTKTEDDPEKRLSVKRSENSREWEIKRLRVAFSLRECFICHYMLFYLIILLYLCFRVFFVGFTVFFIQFYFSLGLSYGLSYI